MSKLINYIKQNSNPKLIKSGIKISEEDLDIIIGGLLDEYEFARNPELKDYKWYDASIYDTHEGKLMVLVLANRYDMINVYTFTAIHAPSRAGGKQIIVRCLNLSSTNISNPRAKDTLFNIIERSN